MDYPFGVFGGFLVEILRADGALRMTPLFSVLNAGSKQET
jgi:hypothetical protein